MDISRSDSPLHLTASERAGAWLLAGCMQFFILEQIVRLGWTLPYSFAGNFISDLGAVSCTAHICSPWHVWMNGSFLLQGVLIASGAILERRRFGLAAVTLLVVCGVALVVVALAPEDAAPRLHVPAAALFFLLGGFGIIAVGIKRRGVLSILIGCLVILSTMLVGVHGVPMLGAVERVAAYSISGWMVGSGVTLLRTARCGQGAANAVRRRVSG